MALRDFGSRMHVLDWVEGRSEDFVGELNRLLGPTGITVSAGSRWKPIGRASPDEARPFSFHPELLPPTVSDAGRNWWLADPHPGAETPNIDLAAAAIFPDGRTGLILIEAKAHVAELTREACGKKKRPDSSCLNHESIRSAIEEAAGWLGGEESQVCISRDACYQFSNRVALSCFLAMQGIPVALIYLGFTGDAGIGKPYRDLDHWRSEVLEHTRAIIPETWWDNQVPWDGGSLWLLIRSLPCLRQTPPIEVRRQHRRAHSRPVGIRHG
jgi:hypothetical protein